MRKVVVVDPVIAGDPQSAAAEPPIDEVDRRRSSLQRAISQVPDAFVALILGLAALIPFLPGQLVPFWLGRLTDGELQSELILSLMVEGGFLMMQGTLTDVATRLQKRPPIWLVVIIAIGIFIFSPYASTILSNAWQRGLVVFLPLFVSLCERFTALWYMPSRSRIEKIAERARVSNRMLTALCVFAIATALMVAGWIFPNWLSDMNPGHTQWTLLAAGAIYFAIAAYDDWRVGTPEFAERPRVLFRYDILGIDYLHSL